MKACEQTGICGVCEGVFMARAEETVVLHGYNRPGDGQIDGRCYGEGRKAWNVTPDVAAEFLARVLRPRLAHLTEVERRFAAGEVSSLLVGRYSAEARDIVTVRIDATDRCWASELESAHDRAQAERADARRRVEHFEAKIAAWAPAPFTPVDAVVGPKPCTLLWVLKDRAWRAKAEVRTVAIGATVAEVLANAAEKGYALPEGTPLPADHTTSSLLRGYAAEPAPKNMKRQVSTATPGPVESKALLAVYDGLDADERAIFDGASFYAVLRCCERYARTLTELVAVPVETLRTAVQERLVELKTDRLKRETEWAARAAWLEARAKLGRR